MTTTDSEHRSAGWARAKLSQTGIRTTSPIFTLFHKLSALPPPKPFISLALGDPTSNPELCCPPQLADVLKANADNCKHNGYEKPPGSVEARKAIAKKFSVACHPVSHEDVFIASSCSAAIDMVLAVLANEGQNVLIPDPGWSHYMTMFHSRGIHTRGYPLLPEKNWEADMSQLPALVDANTVALIINNPSNPCGSVYTREHLLQLIDFAERHHLIVLADEIYCDMAFSSHKFVPAAELAAKVPLISFGGMSKSYMVPGWRVGWAILYDRFDVLSDVRGAMFRMGSLLLGANSLAQSTIPTALFEIPPEYFQRNVNLLTTHARVLEEKLKHAPALVPYAPQGTFYMMVGLQLEKFSDIHSDVAFTEHLVREEGVMVMPVLSKKPFIRLVLCLPIPQLETAANRIVEFCMRHVKK